MAKSVVVLTPRQLILAGIDMAATGEKVSARGIPAREVRYPTLVAVQPWHMPISIPARNANWAIAILEACSIVGQVSVPEWLTDRIGAFSKYREAGVFWGAYGPRVAGQLGLVVDLLKRDPESRQAVITIFDGHRDVGRPTVDVPCTIAIQFMIRNGLLEARTVMRSNDAWLGLTYDVVQFIALQGAIAAALDVPLGPYTHQPGSLHLYETDIAKADGLTNGLPNETVRPSEPIWHGASIDQISRWARDAAGRLRPAPVTRFERWIREELT